MPGPQHNLEIEHERRVPNKRFESDALLHHSATLQAKRLS
jgi:hypothetical protein